ncbi:MAG TPA: beta-galactosidase GalB, partial [Opitutaceae bacterium]|nr:beta-galactosidase GalB [Opitutaceae bacterium]
MKTMPHRAACILLAAVVSAAAGEPRERVSLDADWLFERGDAPDAGDRLSYEALKPWILPTGDELLDLSARRAAPPAAGPAENVSYAQAQFDDGAWRRLDVPHDWAIEGPFQQDLPGATGKLPWVGVGWYRKHFQLPAESAGRRILVDFDGAMSHAAVWLNGHFVGGWPYGYASFRLDLSPFAKPGAENVLAVRLENPPESSRWYPGAGIYRNVWLVTEGPVHVAHWGTTVTTPRVSPDAATVSVNVIADNDSAAVAHAAVSTSIFELDEEGRAGAAPVATAGPRDEAIVPGREVSCTESLEIAHPRLWSLAKRWRYVAVTTLEMSGAVVDRVDTPFGVRTLRFDPDRGFLLNGERVAIQGVCDHHDLGALGSAVNSSALARQVRLLQEMGCNAIRTSHNPPAPELLELCDRMGMLVMDEAFDCWAIAKRPNDYHLLFDDWHEKDLRALIRRDRNHPSVVLWSIGNEIPEQTHPPVSWKLATHLSGIAHEEDRTRPTVSAFNKIESGYNGMQLSVDVAGYNYKPEEYPRFHALNPTIPLVSSETASCVSTRGFYTFPVSDNKSEGMEDLQVSSYDLSAPPWATPPDWEFRGQDRAPFNAGEFVWTGFDYLGEPTPYMKDPNFLLDFTDPAEHARMEAKLKALERIQVTSRSSYFGILDLAGLKKDRFYIYQARWRADLPMAHLLPHWTWPERVGLVTPVHVYTSGDEAELFLNGHSLGRKKRAALEYRLRWDDVRYEPGELKVVAYWHGKPWATDVERTAGPAAAIGLSSDRPCLAADGSDLAYVTVRVNDSAGNLVPRASNRVRFAVSGPGDIVAVDNGDPTTFAPFQAAERNAFNGLCVA